jgi:hypothetical protein
MHTLCTLFLGVCTPCADFFWVHAHFFQTLKIPPFSPSCTGSFRIPVSLIGLITSPTSLDRNSKVLFSVVLKGLKSLHSLHGVHEVCTGLPPDDSCGLLSDGRSTTEKTFRFLSPFISLSNAYRQWTIDSNSAIAIRFDDGWSSGPYDKHP